MRAAGREPAGRASRVSFDIFQTGGVDSKIQLWQKKFKPRGNCALKNYNEDISEQSLKLLAQRLLPEIRKYFSDEKMQKEFEEWLKKKNESKDAK